MKGLLLKNFYMAISYCRSFLLLVAVFLVLGWVDSDNTFVLYYPCIMGSMVVASLVGYDERERWSQYGDTMPYSRAMIVSSYYITALLVGMASLILTFGSQRLRVAVMDGGFADLADLLLMLVTVCLLPPALMLPWMFKFGAEKGRTAYFVTVGIFVALMLTLGMVADGNMLNRSAPAFFTLIAVVAYGFSWYLSICFYQQREL